MTSPSRTIAWALAAAVMLTAAQTPAATEFEHALDGLLPDLRAGECATSADARLQGPAATVDAVMRRAAMLVSEPRQAGTSTGP